MAAPTIIHSNIVRNYNSQPSSSSSFVLPDSASVGDLLVVHTSNGNSPSGSGEVMYSSSGTPWTKDVGIDNGRAVWSKILTAPDLGVSHYLASAPASYGMMYWLFRNAKINKAFTGLYASPYGENPGPAGPAAEDCWGIKVLFKGLGGNFPNWNRTDISNEIAWKEFSAGQTLSSWPYSNSTWHSSNYNYAAIVIDSIDSPPNSPTGLAVSNSPVPLRSEDGATASWTHNDPENNQQVKYQMRWRRI